MTVKLFRLSTGQDVIAEVVEETETSVAVTGPLAIHMMRGADGNPTLGFADWAMLCKPEQSILINKAHLLIMPAEPLDEIEQSYRQQMSSIILPPTTSGKILHG